MGIVRIGLVLAISCNSRYTELILSEASISTLIKLKSTCTLHEYISFKCHNRHLDVYFMHLNMINICDIIIEPNVCIM